MDDQTDINGGVCVLRAFRSRYLFFAVFYLTLLSVVILSMSYSRYTSSDESNDSADVAVFSTDLVITGADETVIGPVNCNFYATCKISDLTSMVPGTCEMEYVRIINRSDCSVKLTDGDILPDEDISLADAYTKLLVDRSSDYIDSHNGIGGAALAYMHQLLDDYLTDPSLLTDEDERSELERLQAKFADDQDFYYPAGSDEPLEFRYDYLTDVKYLDQLVSACNKLTFARLTDPVSGEVLAPGETRSLMLLTWVEHDNVYRDDADQLTAPASDKTPTELIGGGNRADVTEEFRLMFRIRQAD